MFRRLGEKEQFRQGLGKFLDLAEEMEEKTSNLWLEENSKSCKSSGGTATPAEGGSGLIGLGC